MTEPVGKDGLVDPEVALNREVETLSQRFPQADREELDERVHATYDELKEQTTANAHLVALTEGRVTEQLRERGETVHVRGEDVP